MPKESKYNKLIPQYAQTYSAKMDNIVKICFIYFLILKIVYLLFCILSKYSVVPRLVHVEESIDLGLYRIVEVHFATAVTTK